MKLARGMGLVGLVGAALVVVGAPAGDAETIASEELGWCATSSAPCVVSASRNGAAVTAADPMWALTGTSYELEGSRYVSFSVQKKAGPDPYELGTASLSDDWVITLDVGTVVPRVVTGRGRDTSTTRSPQGDGTYRVTVRATPVTITGGCSTASWPWTCPSVAPEERVGYLDGQITDYGVWEDAAQRSSMYGMDYWTNIDVTSVPPEIVVDPTTDQEMLLIRMANSHFRMNGSTLALGASELRIPHTFLQTTYGIPNPATMTGTSLAPSISGGTSGTVNVYQESSGTAMRVDIAGVTFSTRVLRVRRGTIVPTRPTNVRAVRTDVQRGRVAFTKSRPRGAKVSGYVARCSVVRGTHVVTATKKRNASPVPVRRLRAGKAYDCRVRATSSAGRGPWSKVVRMRARP